MKSKYEEKKFIGWDYALHYFDIPGGKTPLVMIHGQGVDSKNYECVFKKLSRYYHIYAVDCIGHGLSTHDKSKYNIKSIGEAMISFIRSVAPDGAYVTGHSSGGLIAAYVAAYSDTCKKLILEDPPLFSCQGDRRLKTYNYLDLSSVCHKYISEKSGSDFISFYFRYQKAWDFFPEKSRDKLRLKMSDKAEAYRVKHPDRPLRVPFWPASSLEAFWGMDNYDPYFGEAFYNDSFHSDIPHEIILGRIKCDTVIMKAKTSFSDDGILLAAMSDDDVRRAQKLIPTSEIIRFDCGHGIHSEKTKKFVDVFNALVQKS